MMCRFSALSIVLSFVAVATTTQSQPIEIKTSDATEGDQIAVLLVSDTELERLGSVVNVSDSQLSATRAIEQALIERVKTVEAEGIAASADLTSFPSVPMHEKSPSRALWWSLGGTAASWAAFLAGLPNSDGSTRGIVLITAGIAGSIAAPSMGHFYAGAHARAWIPLAIRGGGWGLVIGGFANGLGDDGRSETDWKWLIGGGVAVIVGSKIYSIFDAPRAARRHNEHHVGTNEERGKRFRIAPSGVVGADGSLGYGATASFRF